MLQFSTPLRNARLNAIEAFIGLSAKLRLFTGRMPATTAAADSGTVLATFDLPADWMEDAVNATKVSKGSWVDSAADASGRVSYYRLYAADGACHIQGLAAGPWTPSTAYAVDDLVTANGGRVYRATMAGVSASSGTGPSGNAPMADGSTAWEFVQVSPEMSIDNAALVAAQSFTISTFSILDGNA